MTRTGFDWILSCPACDATASADGLPTLCACGHPWLVRYPRRRYTLKDRAAVRRGRSMWRFANWLPLLPGEEPVSLGEGDTPLLAVPRTARRIGLNDLWIKDEGVNPTGAFKSRGISAAVTRAQAGGAQGIVLPTAGNAGVASSAYGARAGLPVRVYAPRSTPPMLLLQIRR
ncbi:MAG TPA: pyridoxal-phosphate dependent enzyme, partial [Gemmatimonadales bacterium]|nr:pyridoxal-phosphate dependent enzyme [Gemmatimonadales bacterium]